jgi:nitroreductase
MPAASTLTVREAAESRRAIRKYLQQPVPEEDLREILRQVSLAPSPDNLQPWRFVVIRDPELKRRMEPAALNQRQVLSAHALIVLYADMEDALATITEVIHPGFDEAGRARFLRGIEKQFGHQSVEERQRYAHGIAYIALSYLLLAAEAMGYRTSPMLGFKPDEVKAILELPSRVTIPALVAIGKGDEPGFPHHRHSVDRIARFR